jgi:hypothetical protein
VWEFECSTEVAASPDTVWALWSNPARWSEFDPGITWARLDGPFVAGATVAVKPKGGPRSSIEVVAAEPLRGFTTLARLPLARMRFEHSLSPRGDGGTLVTSRLRVSGPLGRLFPRLFRLEANEPVMQANLARLAEAEQAQPATPGAG